MLNLLIILTFIIGGGLISLVIYKIYFFPELKGDINLWIKMVIKADSKMRINRQRLKEKILTILLS